MHLKIINRDIIYGNTFRRRTYFWITGKLKSNHLATANIIVDRTTKYIPSEKIIRRRLYIAETKTMVNRLTFHHQQQQQHEINVQKEFAILSKGLLQTKSACTDQS